MSQSNYVTDFLDQHLGALTRKLTKDQEIAIQHGHPSLADNIETVKPAFMLHLETSPIFLPEFIQEFVL